MAKARKPVSNRVAIEIWERDEGACYWCEITLEPDEVVFDHFMPVALGGSDQTSNIVLSCFSCNSRKGQLHPRVAELWITNDMPKCWALDIFDWEHGVDSGRAFFVGAEFVDLGGGMRRVIKMPIAGAGECRMSGCPDCDRA